MDDLIKALVRRKNDIFVLTYNPLTTKAKGKIHEKKKHLEILRLPWFPGLFYELINNPAFEFLYLLPGLFCITPFVFIKENPDVIHAHGLVAGFVGVFWGKIFGKKVVISTHSIYHFPQKGFYSFFVRWIFTNSYVVFCLSEQSKREVVAIGISEKKVKVFTYWINQQLFHKISDGKKLLKLSNSFVVLFVGRLIEEKGIKVLLESAKSWNENISLIVVGTGPLEEKVKQKADGKKIIFVGKVGQDKLPLYYSAADAVIVPSIHEEGFGRVILEALSCGTPVIAAKRGGIVEAINEKVGYLIDITPENIKKTVEHCNRHRIELENKSKEARKLAGKKYSERNVEIIIKAYE